jgi:anaerobic selenocysteine-containing dehydrogenase
VEISWDEALNTIAQRFTKVVADDPRKIVFLTGYGSNPDYYNFVVDFFIKSLGMPSGNNVQTNGPLCSNHLFMMTTTGNMSNSPDYNFCNYLIAMGGTQVDWAPSSGPCRGFFPAIERGMKVVVVDPRCSKEASVGEWIPIRPASELAFELAFLNVMLHEIGLDKLDQQFMKLRSNLPYLIGAGERYYRDPTSGKPMIWDPTSNTAKMFDDPSIKDYALEGQFQVNGQTVSPAFALIKNEMQKYTPEWQEPLTTIPATTVRRLANEFVAAALVGSTIILDGMEFPLRPAAFFNRRAGEGSQDGHYTQIARGLINGLIGGWDVPGGNQGQAWGPTMLKPNADGLVTPIGMGVGYPFVYPSNDISLGTFYPFRHTTPYVAWRAILDPKKYHVPYDVDTLIIYGSNAVVSNGAFQEPMAAFQKIPFIAAISYHLDESTQFADIVLPEPANLEREMKTIQGGYDKGHWAMQQPQGMLYRAPAVQKLYNSKQAEEIIIELAKRMNRLTGKGGLNDLINSSLGLKPPFALDINWPQPYTLSEIIDRDLRNTYGNDRGSAYYKKVGYEFSIDGPKKFYNYAYFPMGKTRYHMFFEHMKEVGDSLLTNLTKNNITVPGWPDTSDMIDNYRPIPHWKPMTIHNAPAEYDMYIINWKTSFMVYGLGANQENPWLYEVTKMTDPYAMNIWINPATAAKKGIKDGDTIVVESNVGPLGSPRTAQMTGTVKITQRIHPECVGVGGNYGRRSMGLNPIAREGPNYNQLLNTEEGYFCPLSAALEVSPKVKVTKV